MKLNNGKLTLLVNWDHTEIELIDEDSNITFARLTLTPEQLSALLSRQAYVPCDMSVYSLDKVGKKMEHTDLVFEIKEETNKDELFSLAKKACPEGWIPDNYFSSQRSIFMESGKKFARAIIRRWV